MFQRVTGRMKEGTMVTIRFGMHDITVEFELPKNTLIVLQSKSLPDISATVGSGYWIIAVTGVLIEGTDEKWSVGKDAL